MKKSSIWTWVISRLLVVGLLFGAAAAQAATAYMPAVTSVLYLGVAPDNTHRFKINWGMMPVADDLSSTGTFNLGIGFRDTDDPQMKVNMSDSYVGVALPVASITSQNDYRQCLEGNQWRLSCLGNVWIQKKGTSGTADFYINTQSNLGKNIRRLQMCTAIQQTQTGPATALGIVPGTCYTGFPTTVNATCSIDTPELLLDHGSLNPLEVNGNVKEMDVDISCSPDVTVSVYTGGGNIIFFGNGSISSLITIDGQNPRRATINGSRTFKLRSTLSASGTPMPSNYGNSTTLLINIE